MFSFRDPWVEVGILSRLVGHRTGNITVEYYIKDREINRSFLAKVSFSRPYPTSLDRLSAITPALLGTLEKYPFMHSHSP
jgi:hypothetical protein